MHKLLIYHYYKLKSELIIIIKKNNYKIKIIKQNIKENRNKKIFLFM